ncbi:uncharacterized protein LOC114944555 [Nylanderia fulva]|uniref:uncharacterized protein LOC114944555 n=1 Tax=Nylanderia fulva TaxID=613905 RepID=UPI0010FADD2A|nr:uncharacterized protein LOC114944555 [Nylanderia fulva]
MPALPGEASLTPAHRVIQSAAPTIPQDSNAAITSLEKSVHQADATAVAALASTTNNTVLLATAMIKLISHSGRTVKVRALLDSGSEASFVSERVAQQLQLRRRRVNVTVSGLQGVTTGRVTHAVSLMIGSELSSTLRIAIPTALVMSKLTPFTPGKQVHKGHWPHLRGIQLADPNYDKPASVDAVLGADVYGMLIESGVKHGQPGEPYAHSTVFGWVLMGAIGHTNYPPGIDIASHHVTIEQDLRQQLQRFWELEEVSGECPLTPDEAYCERLFATTHTRDSDGRYVVRLPRKQEPSLELGDSRCGALRLLLAAESRLRRNPSLYTSHTSSS